MTSSVAEQILSAENLPSLPVVAMKVLELAGQEDVSAADLAGVIGKDPALTARVLRMVNSSLFGLPKPIGSLQQATVALGLRTVRIVALSFSLVDTLHGPNEGGFDYELYWRRSLTTAVMSKLIAEEVAAGRRDEAFVGGLLCDVGLVAAWQAAPQIYKPIWQEYARSRRPVQDIEADMLDTTHAEISAALLDKWNLPEVFCEAARTHHGDGLEQSAAQHRVIANTFYASSRIAEVFVGDVPTTNLEMTTQHCADVTGIAPETLTELMDALDAQLRETANLFKVQIGKSIPYQELRDRAVAQLAVLSVSAERERDQAEERLAQMTTRAANLERKASLDPLTQIANRAAFDQRFEAMVTAAENSQGSVGLIMLDLDHFKQLNDSHGHPAGDEALRQVGRLLKKISDGPQMAARYGGEEFAVLVADATARALRELAEDIRKNIERMRIEHEGTTLNLTASCGAAHVAFDMESATPDEILKRADECLYDAKRGGRNRVEISF